MRGSSLDADPAYQRDESAGVSGTPRELWLVRHGESVANVAASAAERADADVIDIGVRDADVPLSVHGEMQAAALGDWLSARGRPDVFAVSPYLRARQTLDIARGGSHGDQVVIDDRLRDRELGVLDLLTTVGVERRLPEEARRRRWQGKFLYRPPGGESWADVALRIRSFLADLDRDPARRVLVVAHDAIVMLVMYVCCGWTEHELLEFTRTNVVPNASVTTLARPDGDRWWSLRTFGDTTHIERSAAPVTSHPGDRDPEVL